MSGLLSTWLALHALAAGPPCGLELAPEAATDELLHELEARGLLTLRDTACASPRASITKEADAFVLSLVDPGGPEAERRRLREPSAVAAVLSSWVREDLISGLLEAPTPPIPAPAVTATAEPDPAPTATQVDTSGPEPANAPSGLSLGVGAELAADTDGELWLGAAALFRPARSRFAPMFLLRFAHGAVSGTSLSTGAARTGLELLGFLEGTFTLGAFTLRPGAGAGLGLLHSARSLDGTCQEECPAWVEDDFSITRFGPRLEARLGLTRALGNSAAIELSLSATFAPLAERAGLLPDYAVALPSEDERARLALASEPLVQGRVSLALHWGAP